MIVIRKDFSIAAPGDHRTQSLLGGLRRHVVFELVQEAFGAAAGTLGAECAPRGGANGT